MHYSDGRHSQHSARALEFTQQSLNKWFEGYAYPANDGFTVSFQDITQRKREEELCILAAIVESSDDAIFSNNIPIGICAR